MHSHYYQGRLRYFFIVLALLMTICTSAPVYAGSKKSISSAKITLKKKNVTYTGKRIKLKGFTVKLKNKKLKSKRDFKVSYKNNRNAGTAYLIIKGKGKYKGTVKKKFKISPVSIICNTSVAAQNYTGREIRPAVKVQAKVNKKMRTLKAGRDYTVQYSSNINPGTASITVKGKGNYKGKAVISFTIRQSESKTVITRLTPTTRDSETGPVPTKVTTRSTVTTGNSGTTADKVNPSNQVDNNPTPSNSKQAGNNPTSSDTPTTTPVESEVRKAIRKGYLEKIEAGETGKVAVSGATLDDYKSVYISVLSNPDWAYAPITMPLGDAAYVQSVASSLSFDNFGYIVGSDLKSVSSDSLSNKKMAKKWLNSSGVSASMSDKEALKMIEQYIAKRLEYERTVKYAEDAWDSGLGNCQAYAEILYCMCREQGIPVRMVSGTADSEPHMWNQVKIDGTWYHTDACWYDAGFGMYATNYFLSASVFPNRIVNEVFG